MPLVARGGEHVRLAGEDRYGTAAAVSREAVPGGAVAVVHVVSARRAVLVTGRGTRRRLVLLPGRVAEARPGAHGHAAHGSQSFGHRRVSLETRDPPLGGMQVCHSPRVHRMLLGTGSGLMVVSLLVALLLSAADPLWAAQHLTLLTTFAWAQQAALVLGAALLAAGLVVVRLAPPPVARPDAGADAPSDWFS